MSDSRYLEQIQQVACQAAYASEIKVFLKNLWHKDSQQALHIAKTLFFAEETHPQVRYQVANTLGKSNNQTLFNQLLSYLILRNFFDPLALIAALKGFANPTAVASLVQHYRSYATFEECLEIIDAVAAVQSPETIEFLSQVYNHQLVPSSPLQPTDMKQIRECASSALSRQLMRLDPL